MTMDDKYFHSPAQTAKLKYDVDCLARHIETLEESLENANKKYSATYKEMVDHCEHDYQPTGKMWTPLKDNEELQMQQRECKRCGRFTWKMEK